MASPEDTIRRIITEESVGPRAETARQRCAMLEPAALPVARADLIYLWDDYHNQYLDYGALYAPLGHRHPVITAAVAGQDLHYGLMAPQGQHLLRWPTDYAKHLSEAFSVDDRPPKRVLWTEGEREAVRMAVELARADKPVAIVDTGWHQWLAESHDRSVLIGPDSWSVLEWSSIGALLLSTVSRSAREIVGVRELILMARTAKVPVIIDESVTGFGRTGYLWGQEKTALISDITVLGGAVGGGYPLGAVVADPDFLDRPVSVSPQSGHPVACAAGAALLVGLSFGLLDHVLSNSEILDTGLDQLCTQFENILSGHHGTGMFRGLRFTHHADAERFAVDCRKHGLYVPPPLSGTVLICPPLIVSDYEMRRSLDVIASVLLDWESDDMSL